MAKTIIEDIAASIPEEETGMDLENPEGLMSGDGSDIDFDDDDIAAAVPKMGDRGDISGMGGMDEIGGEPGGKLAGETPIVQPGETNAAPPSPGSFEPSGVIKMDAPLLIKMLEHAKSGADVHQLVSSAATMCGDPSCSHLTMDHFGDLSSVAPAAEVQEPGIGGMDEVPADFAGAVAGGNGDEGEIEVADGEELGDKPGEPEDIEGEEPGGDPVGEGEIGEGELDIEKPEESEEEVEDEDEAKDEDENEKPFEEAISNIADPVLEKFQPPTRQTATDNKSDPVPAKGGKGKKDKGKPAFLKKKEDEDEGIAESMSKMIGLMSSKGKLAFKGTQEPHVAQFTAQPSPQRSRVLGESINKALKNQEWLKKNGLENLTKYKRASIINTFGMGDRHLVVLD